MKEQELDELLEKTKADPKDENVRDYVVRFIESQVLNPGIYDYFYAGKEKKSGNIVKMHYRGIFRDFSLIDGESDLFHLVFAVDAIARIEVPSCGIYEEEKTKESLHKEIETKTPEYALKWILDDLRMDLYGIYDVGKFKIELHPKWTVDDQIEYDWD